MVPHHYIMMMMITVSPGKRRRWTVGLPSSMLIEYIIYIYIYIYIIFDREILYERAMVINFP